MSEAQKLLLQAKQNKFALGAFNFVNMEMLQAIAAAAQNQNSPVMIQASCGAIDYAGIDYIMALAKTAQTNSSVPLILHLDHGDYDHTLLAIEAGFDSVMFDGSMLSDEENYRLTKEITDLAHAKNIQVEAEIGRVGGVEEHISVSEEEARYTQPEEAVDFVAQTGIDSLAIAIGTAHGVYKGQPVLRFDLIEKINTALPHTALVMHGSSGVSLEDCQKAIAAGISKINIDTDLRIAFTDNIRETLTQNPDLIDLRKYLKPGAKAAQAIVEEKIMAFGSQNQA